MLRCHNVLAVGQVLIILKNRQIFMVRCFYFVDGLCKCYSFWD